MSESKTANLSFISVKAIVKASPIHGKGLFALDRIGKGEIVCIKGGYIFDLATREALEARLGPAEVPVANVSKTQDVLQRKA